MLRCVDTVSPQALAFTQVGLMPFRTQIRIIGNGVVCTLAI